MLDERRAQTRSPGGVFGSTFVGSLHILLVKHQVVALHCSRVELQPENNFTLRGDVTLVITFDLKEKTEEYVGRQTLN